MPALALITDLLAFFREHNINAASINSLNRDEWEIVKHQLTQENSLKFFLWTPERMGDDQDLQERIEYLIGNDFVDYFVVDEAHYIDAINEITNANVHIRTNRENYFTAMRNFREIGQHIKWIALTTAGETYGHQLSTDLGMANAQLLRSPSTRENIFYKVFKKNTSSVELTNMILQKFANVSGIIFCNSENQLNNVLGALNREGVSAIGYCGRWPQENIQRWANGEFKVIVAKGESFGFGLNHFVPPSIRFVIHRYVPGNMHAYYHVSILE